MNLFSTLEKIDKRTLFLSLFDAGTEKELEKEMNKFPELFNNAENWRPLGGNENNFGVIENQQSAPIAALIEKVTNSIDAILMKKCYEAGIDPRSKEAPHSVSEAVDKFFPNHKSDWNLTTFRRQQSEDIQIVADGTPRDTSVIIYDNGEGQHPHKFENTFLSLLRGNKNEIHFVQGKYNMGGSGAIVFCGSRGYQLVCSKRYDDTGEFGFTLIRQHPLSLEEQQTKKNTWYEYFVIDGKVPSFHIDGIDLKLYARKFTTGTVIKLYSYQFPSGYSGFAQELNQSINEYLFEPALPILTVDKKERYPNNKVLELDLYGLKRRLDDSKEYIEKSFSEDFHDDLFGKMKVTCFVFKSKIKDWDAKKTKENIQRRFFKNDMSVLFSMNGQVHGHYTSEFITRSLKMNLLKNHLLIHVDCTNMKYDFRKELFMASRDRLKDGKETRALRKFLAEKLGAKGSQLFEISKHRKDSISIGGENTSELLKNFTQNLPINSDLRKLLGNAFKLEEKKKPAPSPQTKPSKTQKEEKPFHPQRYPSYLKLMAKNDGEKAVAKIPLGGEKTLKFETDVEDEYFDRVDDPGDLQISLLNFKPNDSTGGNAQGKPSGIEEVFNVVKSSPNEGTIRVVLSPKKEVQVGDAVQVKVTLSDKGKEHDQIFWVKISEPQQPKEEVPQKEEIEEPIGLPQVYLVYQEEKEGELSWSKFEDNTSQTMNYSTVMYPMAEGESLDAIYINMDSNVLKSFKSRQKNISEAQVEIAEKRYISSVYFHTLFLYTITKNRKYQIKQEDNGKEKEVDISEYVKDLFDSFYSEFLLNFGIEDLIELSK